MTQLFPDVIDASNLGAKFTPGLTLPVAVEGQAASDGNAVVATPYSIQRPSEAATRFGATSSLYTLVNFLLGRGVSPVIAVASAKGSTPNLVQRQTAWANLETNENIRLRMTDSTSQSDIDALGTSCQNANLLFNKQVAVCGLASGISKAALISAATAINDDRVVLVGPAVYDTNNTLLTGNFAAAAVVSAVSQNANIADDLDRVELPNLNGIELDSNNMAVFRIKVVSGIVVNDFEDLLQGGVSPLMPGRTLPTAISHLRMTYVTNATFDALMTRLIVDQVFLDVRDYVFNQNYLRKGNTVRNRTILATGVENLLLERQDWITPVTQIDGTLGYNVQVVPDSTSRKVTISYEGTVVRGIQVVEVDGQLTIPV